VREASRVVTIIGKLVAAGMTQHVRMNCKRKLRSPSCSLQHPQEPSCGHWRACFCGERMQRQGVEDIKGKTPLVLDRSPKQPRRKLSKAELREQAAAAFLAWREGQKAKDK